MKRIAMIMAALFMVCATAGGAAAALIQPFMLSSQTADTLAGLSLDSGQIVAYDPVGQAATLYADPFPTQSENVDAFHVQGDTIYFSASSAFSAGGTGYDAGDIVSYDRSTQEYAFVFDDRDVFELPADIDAVARLTDGRFILSTEVGETLITGSQSTEKGDLVLYDPASRTGSIFLQGSDLFDIGENIDAVHVENDTDIFTVYLSTETSADMSAHGLQDIEDRDVVRFTYNPLTSEITNVALAFDARYGGTTVFAGNIDGFSMPATHAPIPKSAWLFVSGLVSLVAIRRSYAART